MNNVHLQMPQPLKLPLRPGPEYLAFIDQSDAIKSARLSDAIPKELLTPNVWRGLLGFLISYVLYVAPIVGLAYAPHWLLYIPLWIVSGLGGWGLHCIAHDCGHNSFSRSKAINMVVGHVALLPLVYPFLSWKHVHTLHHMHTNSLEMDTDWRPMSRAVYRRLPIRDRIIYFSTRSWAFWAGTINYWAVSGIRPGFFPKSEMRVQARMSLTLVIAIAAVYIYALCSVAGWMGVLVYFVGPWLAIHAWFSATTLMHHTTQEIPFLASKDWSVNASRLLSTTDYVYPRWLLFLTHNISIHTAHHVLPIVPFYNLPKAQEALKRAFPGMVRERPFTFAQLWQILKECRFYDETTGYYESRLGPEVRVGGAPVQKWAGDKHEG
jgi:omega-6 fatty acid desaturase (delta-12 desaturase)